MARFQWHGPGGTAPGAGTWTTALPRDTRVWTRNHWRWGVVMPYRASLYGTARDTQAT
ncbi:hypothetical protein [Novacetimonas hansenii]|uniref:hypothetical protein n=1 Tax=Novacetimonas hansenii TaxID=436 RepID=UPI00158810AA|nr:hypothetical protein [Novacetimonas hansenii]